MVKPTSHLSWTDGDAAKQVEPTAGKKLLGWTKGERPPFQTMNHLFFRQDEWNKYFEGVTDLLATQGIYFDFFVGVGGTHATINDAMADVLVVAQSRILVLDDVAASVTQIISKNDIYIEFKRGAFDQAALNPIGLQVTAERVTVTGGRFTDFNGVGDVAIELSAASKNCIITRNRFFDCDLEISDLGVNNSLNGNMTEQI